MENKPLDLDIILLQMGKKKANKKSKQKTPPQLYCTAQENSKPEMFWKSYQTQTY